MRTGLFYSLSSQYTARARDLMGRYFRRIDKGFELWNVPLEEKKLRLVNKLNAWMVQIETTQREIALLQEEEDKMRTNDEEQERGLSLLQTLNARLDGLHRQIEKSDQQVVESTVRARHARSPPPPSRLPPRPSSSTLATIARRPSSSA